PNVFTAYVGAGTGFPAPSNAPRTAMGPAPGGIVVPPAIRALDGAGSEGLNLRQTYTVTMVKGSVGTATRTELGGTRKLYAVPTNVGPRTMPDYRYWHEAACICWRTVFECSLRRWTILSIWI
ncbi:MAG: hypothetical protein WKF37_20255, partial [Bryobacteraceae bacterium]